MQSIVILIKINLKNKCAQGLLVIYIQYVIIIVEYDTNKSNRDFEFFRMRVK